MALLSEHLVLHCVGILCKLESHFPGDLLGSVQVKDGIVHGDHSLLPVGLHVGDQLMGFAFTDQVPYGTVYMEHLKGCKS